MTVGEIERLRYPVAVVIGIGLQIDGGDAVTLDPVQQHVDVLVHLLRILVVDIVQIHVHQALHLPLPGIAPHDLVQGFEAGILLQQIAAHRAARVTQLVEPFRQGEGVGHPRRTGEIQRSLVEGAVGPDQDPWCPTGLLPELTGRCVEVGFYPGPIVGHALVAILAPACGGHRRLHVALRVGEQPVVGGESVGGQLHQSGVLHLADLRPADEVAARQLVIAVRDHLVIRHIQPAAHQRKDCRVVVKLEQRIDQPVEALVAVIEAEQDRLLRQRCLARFGIQDLLEADRVIALLFDPVEVADQGVAPDGLGIELEVGGQFQIDDIVVAEHHVVIGLPGRLRQRRQQCKQQNERSKPAFHHMKLHCRLAKMKFPNSGLPS